VLKAYPLSQGAPATDAWWPWAGAVVLAAIAGIGVVTLSAEFGERTVYYVAIAVAVGGAALVACTRKEPLRFVFLALIVGFPFASALVPPGRLNVDVFDVTMIALTIAVVIQRLIVRPETKQPLFPTRSLAIAWLLLLPCIAFSTFPATSVLNSIPLFTYHTFFWFVLAEHRRENGFERLALFLAGTLLVLALGVGIDYALRMNLSLRGANLNTLTYLEGLEIYRAGGFFQDPQRAAAFLAGAITFLLVLTLRGRFEHPRTRAFVWVAIFAGLAALPLTISRSAILACLAVSALASFAFNAWATHLKLAVTALAVAMALIVAQTSLDLWIDVLPTAVRERFLHIDEEFQNRMLIWADTWDMFAEHPLTGIGPGAFREYLLATRPGVLNYYGIGSAVGAGYVPDQPESGYLKVLYEGGVLGTLALLVVLVDTARRALGVVVDRHADSAARTECIAALAGLTTFGVTFVTVFTVNDPRVGALWAWLLAVIWHRSLERSRAAGGR